MKLQLQTTLAIAALHWAVPSGAAPKAGVPNAVELLTESVRASKNAGPLSSTYSIVVTQSGKLSGTISGEVKRNDKSHSVTTARLRIGDATLARMRYYVNGETEFTIDETEGEFQRSAAKSASKPESILNSIAASLANPKVTAPLARLPVGATEIEGRPAWRLSWIETDAPNSAQGPVRVTVITDRADGLVRRFSTSPRKGTGLSLTMAYRHQRTPFPARTFVFTPPAGAKEAAE